VDGIAGLEKEKLLLFGGWSSASRGTGATMQILGEILGVTEQFQGVDELRPADDGSFEVKERIEGGGYLRSRCAGAPAVLGWATGNLPEPPNNPQVGMANMRRDAALQKAQPAAVAPPGWPTRPSSCPAPAARRASSGHSRGDIAREIEEWIKG
jgi:electron transfer flavoprotein beta subunit